jgi:hypothetical protein
MRVLFRGMSQTESRHWFEVYGRRRGEQLLIDEMRGRRLGKMMSEGDNAPGGVKKAR